MGTPRYCARGTPAAYVIGVTQHPRLRPHRDYEEGMAGRVYDVCDACIVKEHKQLVAEDE